MEHPLTAYRRTNSLTLDDLAPRFGINAPGLWKWENRRVPAERVLDVERATGIPRHELRPDIYPAPETEALAS